MSAHRTAASECVRARTALEGHLSSPRSWPDVEGPPGSITDPFGAPRRETLMCRQWSQLDVGTRHRVSVNTPHRAWLGMTMPPGPKSPRVEPTEPGAVSPQAMGRGSVPACTFEGT